jgi:hypothetical protein
VHRPVAGRALDVPSLPLQDRPDHCLGFFAANVYRRVLDSYLVLVLLNSCTY